MNYKYIKTHTEDGVGIITLNRPEKLNALSFALGKEVDQVLCDWDVDDNIKAIIVTGAGDRAFSAGADIHEMVDLSIDDTLPLQAKRWDYYWHLATCKKPTIGALNGLAYGGGATVASCFDIRVGCPKTQFKFLAAAYGRLNSTWSLPLVVGFPMAKELLYTGRLIEAEEADKIGLLNHLVDEEELMNKSMEIALTIAGNYPDSVQAIKKLLHDNIGAPLRDHLDVEWNVVQGSLQKLTVKEGFKDFLARKGKSSSK